MKKILFLVATATMMVACGGSSNSKSDKNKLTLDDNGIKNTTTLIQGAFIDMPVPTYSTTTTKETTEIFVANFDFLTLSRTGDESSIPADAAYINISLPKELFGKTLDLSKSTYEAQNRVPYYLYVTFYNGGEDFGFYFDENYIEDSDIVSGTLKTTRNGSKISISLDFVTTDGRKVKANYSATFTDMGVLPESKGTGTIKFNNVSKDIKWGGFIHQTDEEYPEVSLHVIYLTPEKVTLANFMGEMPSGTVALFISDAALGQTLDIDDERYMLMYVVDNENEYGQFDFESGTVKITKSGAANFQIAVNLTATDKSLQVTWNGTLGDLATAVGANLAPRRTPKFTAPSVEKLKKLW